MRRILFFLLFGCFALQLSASKFNFNIISPAPLQRSGAPIPITLQTFFKGASPLSGLLEIKVFTGPELVATVQTNEITIVPGTQMRNMLLPPIEDMGYYSNYLEITFITPTKRYSGGRQKLVSLHDEARIFTILTGYRDFQRASSINFAKELKCKNLTGEKNDLVHIGKSGIVKLKQDSFPKSLEGYCAYNMVVLDGEFFSEMDVNELDVLKEWVFAGGSLFIDVANDRFELRHLNFMNDLIKADSPKNPTLLLAPSGDLSFSENSEFYHYNPEFGRLALFTKKLNSREYFKTSEWRSLLAFLWRVNSNRLKCVINNRSWRYDKDDESYKELYQDNFRGTVNRYYSYQYSNTLKEVFRRYISLFLPKATKMLPIWLLILVLLSFILFVGPVDYMLLGKLKKHNLTWIIFPLISIIYAFMIVYLADYYMGTSDHIGTVEIMDEGSNKQILRSVKYEIVFTGTSKTFVRDCRKEFYSRQDAFVKRNSSKLPYKYSGLLFSHYHAEFATVQWRPTISRVNSFQPINSNHPTWSFPDKWDRATKKDFLKQNFTSGEEFLDISKLNDGSVVSLRESQDCYFKMFISDLKECMNRYAGYEALTPYLFAVSPTPEYGKNHLIIGDSTDKECKVIIVSIYNESTRKVRIYRRVYRKKLPLSQYAVTDADKKIEIEKNQQD